MKDTELERDKYLLMVSILSDQNGRNFSGVSKLQYSASTSSLKSFHSATA